MTDTTSQESSSLFSKTLEQPDVTDSSHSGEHEPGEHKPGEHEQRVPTSIPNALESHAPQKHLWKISIGTIFILLGIAGAAWYWWQQQQMIASEAMSGATPVEEQPQGLSVRLGTVEAGVLQDSSTFVGTLEAKETVELRSEVDGTIEAILVEAGQTVTQGTLLMRINPEKQQAALEVDRVGIQAAQATEQRVRSELEALRSERIAQVAELQLQEQEFGRISTLVEEGALEDQRLDQVVRDRSQADAQLAALDRRIQAAEAQLQQAQRNVAQSEAQVALMQEELNDTEVLAPFDGVVGDIPVKVGSYVEVADPLTNLVQNSVLELRLPIPLEQGNQLTPGLPVEIQTESDQILATGAITFVSPQVDISSQTILAKATFTNFQGILRDQQFVRAAVIWTQKSDAILIPSSALVLQGSDRFVYLVQGEDSLSATLQPVEVGALQVDRVEIVNGLKPGDRIVISGKQKIFDGAPIVALPDN